MGDERPVSRAEYEALVTRVEALEARHVVRDAWERAVLPAIAAAIGGRRFTSAALLAHTDANEALAAALEAADVVTVRECGKLLARLEAQPIAGLRLVRVDECREGIVWSVQVSNSQTRTA